ncbi:PH domain-containing protein [Pedobacter agri]|uniref:PH domain-containing protein n=1 Tax=Pedobacter agri TaxID=454586 RepID=A0A9X3DG73_9SPHI|nr:PH domain-containing protein [Pedobacter agri]MCX3266677.1 PH domain-containing protein [Pedobacter agri]
MLTENFTNDAIDIDSLPKYQEIVLKKPHVSYWKVICINLIICFLLLGIIAAFLLVFNDEIKPYLIAVVSAYIMLLICFFVVFWASFRKRGYAIRTQDVIYKDGIIAESTTIVPLNRIQHIELNEGVLSRMFKLGSLQIFTAGGVSGHLRIGGIPIDEAKSIRDLILNKLDSTESVETETNAGE